MATTQQIREGEAELAGLLRRVEHRVGQIRGEAMAASPLHPDVRNLCALAAEAVAHLQRGMGVARSRRQSIENLRRRGEHWLNVHSSRMLRTLARYNQRDLDTLAACMARVEAVARLTPPNLRRLRTAIAQRLNMPRAAEALYEDEGEAELLRNLWNRVTGRRPSQPPPENPVAGSRTNPAAVGTSAAEGYLRPLAARLESARAAVLRDPATEPAFNAAREEFCRGYRTYSSQLTPGRTAMSLGNLARRHCGGA